MEITPFWKRSPAGWVSAVRTADGAEKSGPGGIFFFSIPHITVNGLYNLSLPVHS